MSVYFSVQHCIKPTWINDRDQFYAPHDDSWQADTDFLGDCLTFMLFHGQNCIPYNQGANHFIPFKEAEAKARGRYVYQPRRKAPSFSYGDIRLAPAWLC
ncbi:hypothetical protein [Helicobacter salomonis]|uniref:hypothetical protein n=1 Tax=Helicobacter salomonis TaxID=56878 RepID=UPI000CF0EF95|nr:hypothetical protein [Helicobacter salomonis]